MKRGYWFGIVFGLVGGLVGCDGGSSPVEQCDDFVDVVCDRAVQCLAGAGAHATCVQEIQTVISCGSAKQVSTSYDRCMTQLESTSCAVLFPTNPQSGSQELQLPADCMAVILTRQGAGVSVGGGLDDVTGSVEGDDADPGQ